MGQVTVSADSRTALTFGVDHVQKSILFILQRRCYDTEYQFFYRSSLTSAGS